MSPDDPPECFTESVDSVLVVFTDDRDWQQAWLDAKIDPDGLDDGSAGSPVPAPRHPPAGGAVTLPIPTAAE